MDRATSAHVMYPATIEPGREKGLVTDARSLLGVGTYAATPRQVSLARHWVRGLLAPHVDDGTLFDIALCAGELVDNARKHGCPDGAITVSVYVGAGTIRLEVMDDGSAETIPHVAGNCLAEDGHGLQIISHLACRWGRRKDQGGNQVVWCEFAGANTKERDEGK
ncbi:MAG TPA: ATP-binding protein [Streptosporangiaceae bacterium]|nr:ATP-binding protein [Streptosporangiaceae bacterium]